MECLPQRAGQEACGGMSKECLQAGVLSVSEEQWALKVSEWKSG